VSKLSSTRAQELVLVVVKSRATDIINNLVGASSTVMLQHCHAACRVFGAGPHPAVRTPSASSTPSSTSYSAAGCAHDGLRCSFKHAGRPTQRRSEGARRNDTGAKKQCSVELTLSSSEFIIDGACSSRLSAEQMAYPHISATTASGVGSIIRRCP
jgi:hypothetical protein